MTDPETRSSAEVKNDDNGVDELLVTSHARGALASPEFSKRCQEAGVRAVTICKLINAFRRPAQAVNPFDRISDVSHESAIPIEAIESAFSLPPGLLARLRRASSKTNVNALRQKDPARLQDPDSGEQCMLQWLRGLRPYGTPKDQEEIDAAHEVLKGLIGEA